MVLHGIGGRTVEEAKQRMSYAEYRAWTAYMQKRGSLNVGLRLEAGFAVVSTQINHALGGKAEVSDFAPHLDQRVASVDDIAKMFGARRKT